MINMINQDDVERQGKQLHPRHFFPKKKVPQVGFEPMTLCSPGECFTTKLPRQLSGVGRICRLRQDVHVLVHRLWCYALV